MNLECFASVSLARTLLARGANPNASFVNEYGSMSAVYGAAGRLHDAELTRLVRGAAGAAARGGRRPRRRRVAVPRDRGAEPGVRGATAGARGDGRGQPRPGP